MDPNWCKDLELCGACSGLKSSSNLIYTEISGEEIQTSLQGIAFLNLISYSC